MTEDPGDTEHPPETDIDQYITDCNFRVERMGGDSLWLAAYTEDSEEPDHHYDITVTEEEGLHVSHRTEYPD
jgi:hypothetical protein